MLKIQREDVCELDTNKLCWKSAKQLLKPDGSLLDDINDYEGIGRKEYDFRSFMTLTSIDKALESYQLEDVDAYSVLVGRLLRWI